LVFQAFKSCNTTIIDTLTPTTNAIIEIYSQIDSSLELIKEKDFPSKYQFHNRQFKNKCKKIMWNATYLDIDWKRTTLVNIEYEEKTIKKDDSVNSKTLAINYLNIYFLFAENKYLLQFKGIHLHKGLWKLGENVRIKSMNEK
jgi:hypothetical protein